MSIHYLINNNEQKAWIKLELLNVIHNTISAWSFQCLNPLTLPESPVLWSVYQEHKSSTEGVQAVLRGSSESKIILQGLSKPPKTKYPTYPDLLKVMKYFNGFHLVPCFP